MSEQDLIDFQQIKSGDLRVYESFFRKNYADIVRYAHKFVRDKLIAEEIAQEVFMYLWEKRAVINVQSSLKSYLYSATKNRSINYLKLELPKIQAQMDISEFEIGIQSEYVEKDRSKFIEKAVKAAIDELPKKCREIFVLSRNAGLTYDEIAEDLDLSKKTVENQMGIALKKLRDSLRPVMEFLKKN